MKKIISNISRLQEEKQKLLTKYENAMDEIDRMKNDAQLKEEMENKQYTAMCNTKRVTVCHCHIVLLIAVNSFNIQRSSSLVEEVAKLKQRVAELEELQQQRQEAGVQTDTEKELEKKVSNLSSELVTITKDRDVYLAQVEVRHYCIGNK